MLDAPDYVRLYARVPHVFRDLRLYVGDELLTLPDLGGDLFYDTVYQGGCRFVIELPKVK